MEEVTDDFCSGESFHTILESDNCEIYTVKYTDTSNISEAQDALNYIEEKVNYNV